MTLDIFLLSFGIIFINELGDKSQILAMTSSLAYHKRRLTLFLSGSLALVLSSALAIGAAHLFPDTWIPYVEKFAGAALCIFALWLLFQLLVSQSSEEHEGKVLLEAGIWSVFWTQFVLVFAMEFGDKTQLGIVALALKYQEQWAIVLFGAVSALVLTQAMSVWGVHFIPQRFIKTLQVVGAILLFLFGVALGGFT